MFISIYCKFYCKYTSWSYFKQCKQRL